MFKKEKDVCIVHSGTTLSAHLKRHKSTEGHVTNIDNEMVMYQLFNQYHVGTIYLTPLKCVGRRHITKRGWLLPLVDTTVNNASTDNQYHDSGFRHVEHPGF